MLRPINDFFEAAATVYGASVTGGSSPLPFELRTPPGQWEYSASFPRLQAPPPARVLGVRVRLHVERGALGISWMEAGTGTLRDEAQVGPSLEPRDVEILAGSGDQVAGLMIRNASADGPSAGRILGLQCFEVWQPPDTVRDPPLSAPAARAGWSRYYGPGGATMVEQVRSRQFEALDRPVVVEWRDGLRLELRPGEQLSRALYISGTYEPNTLRILQCLLAPNDVFLDVGANVGVMSLVASRWVGPGGRVYAFEPSDREARRLEAHIALNAASNITIVQAAVAAAGGEAVLRVADAPYAGLNTLGSRFAYDGIGTVREQRVSTVTLDDFVAGERLERVAVIKLDIEGAEGAALEGGGEVLRTQRPALVMEIVPRALEANGSSAATIDQRLRQHDYRCFTIDDATGALVGVASLASAEGENVVALPAEQADVLRRRCAV
jgi:FkbM family methyltransferase